MKTIKMSSAHRSLAEYAAGMGDQIIVVTDRNRPVVAIVPLKNVDRESIALSAHPEFLRLIARSRAGTSPQGEHSRWKRWVRPYCQIERGVGAADR